MRLDPDRLFSPLDLARRRDVLVAVSGGSDSTALLHLFRSFADRRDLRIVAATVDHGLRAASADEARQVAAACAALGIEHRTLRWTGDKPASGIQAAARLARYDLLAEAAIRAGTDLVLLGHTANDQRETVAMRRARASAAGRGDAGMARATLYRDRTWFARPLLDVSREELRAFLSGAGTGWIDDPANLDRRFERVRVREDGASALADAAHRLDENARAAALLDRVARVAPGLLRLPATLPSAPGGITALRMLLAVVGGADHLPDRERATALAARLAASPLRATLSRTMIDARGDGIFLYRESRSLPPVCRPRAGDLWDGRYRLEVEPAAGQVLAPLGSAAREIDTDIPAGVPQAVVRAALAAEPALFEGGTFVRPLAPDEARPVLGPWRSFLPAFDLGPANALRNVLGLPDLPPSPWRDHIWREA